MCQGDEEVSLFAVFIFICPDFQLILAVYFCSSPISLCCVPRGEGSFFVYCFYLDLSLFFTLFDCLFPPSPISLCCVPRGEGRFFVYCFYLYLSDFLLFLIFYFSLIPFHFVVWKSGLARFFIIMFSSVLILYSSCLFIFPQSHFTLLCAKGMRQFLCLRRNPTSGPSHLRGTTQLIQSQKRKISTRRIDAVRLNSRTTKKEDKERGGIYFPSDRRWTA